jgi:hypothetical protein
VFPYVFVWANNPVRAALQGRRCRVLVRSRRLNSCLVEFEDGERVVVSRNALRRATDPQAPGSEPAGP